MKSQDYELKCFEFRRERIRKETQTVRVLAVTIEEARKKATLRREHYQAAVHPTEDPVVSEIAGDWYLMDDVEKHTVVGRFV